MGNKGATGDKGKKYNINNNTSYEK